jgi:cytidylate kinase
MHQITITIDGPASAGKGTVARMVAKSLDYGYVDTGALYRAVTFMAIRSGVSLSDGETLGVLAGGLSLTFHFRGEENILTCDGEDISKAIRTDDVSVGSSIVAAHPQVRQALLAKQRALGAMGGVVFDGRDTGTVVVPKAEVKIFLDASIDERAGRRHADLIASGVDITLAEVSASLAIRDKRDMERSAAPLVAADDALIIDSTAMSASAVAQRVVLAAVSVLRNTGAVR